MHTKEFINIIEEQAGLLGITVRHLTDEWAMQLRVGEQFAFIVGYTFPLNDAVTYKIIRNKNLCSEVLNARGIPNVPHISIYSPKHLEKHGIPGGNGALLANLVGQYGYPVLLKKNNSTKGEGVYLAKTVSQLEDLVSRLNQTEAVFCFSPFRKQIREFRTVILDGQCLLVYEKLIPFVMGDGVSTLLELLAVYLANNTELKDTKGKLFDPALISRFTDVPADGETILLQWKHNRLRGSNYRVSDEPLIAELGLSAAKAVNARFVAVDVIWSAEIGYEVLEINASVGLHFTFFPKNSGQYQLACSIYSQALKKIFEL